MRFFKLLVAAALLTVPFVASAQTGKPQSKPPISNAFEKKIAAYQKALLAKEYKKALTELDAAFAMRPGAEFDLVGNKVTLLLRTDQQAAYGYSKKVADTKFRNQALQLNNIAWALASDKDKLPRSFYTLSIEIVQRAVSMGEVSKQRAAIQTLPYSLDTLAFAYYKVGDTTKAIKIQERAIAAAKLDKQLPPAVMKEILEHMEMFKGKFKV